MNYFVAMRFDPEECALLELFVLKDLHKLMKTCDILSTAHFRWASCPGGTDPDNPEQMYPIYFSYDMNTGEEGQWEIFKAPGEVTADALVI
jgi:hypothetical protein